MSSRFIASLGLCSLLFVGGLLAIHLGVEVIATKAPEPPPLLRDPHPEEAELEVPEPSALTFAAAGDIMLARTVDTKMEQKGMAYPFEKMRDYLDSVDFAFANLECPIVEGRDVEANEMVFRADPGVEAELARAGFSVVSLANNHSPNFGAAGLRSTFALLDQARIAYAGAGEDASSARQPVLLEQKGIRLAFLAYNDTDVVPDSYAAGADRPGTVFMDIEPMRQDVASASELADLVIVSMHSGTEYEFTPNPRQEAFARAAIDAGAELVIGHHPHVVQTVERYQGKYILYSLGNFIFDQMWSRETREGMVASITLTAEGVQDIHFQPVVIDDYAQPRPATTVEAAPILDRLAIELESDGSLTETQ